VFHSGTTDRECGAGVSCWIAAVPAWKTTEPRADPISNVLARLAVWHVACSIRLRRRELLDRRAVPCGVSDEPETQKEQIQC
jgi:hypothetical protein